jgi:hypothetical protein
MSNRLSLVLASALAGLGLFVFVPPALATHDPTFSLSQAESRDPVPSGEAVTYTATFTNQGSGDAGYGEGHTEAVEIWVETMTTKLDGDAAVDNPYLEIKGTKGSCAVEPPGKYGYTGGECYLGPVELGETVQISATVQANNSLEHWVSLYACDPDATYDHWAECQTFRSDIAETSVVHPPSFSGSRKIGLSGFPDGCATKAFTVRARAKASEVRNITAWVKGPRTESGAPADGNSYSDGARKSGNRVSFKVPAAKLDAGFYDLSVVARRKGEPKLKRTATFQIC